MKEKTIENGINPSNILLKLNWCTSIEMLNDKEKSSILTNIFRYHTGKDLVPMTKAASLFFSSATDVFDYNIEKYKQKVEGNRINGRKGGRPKIKNPSGLINNPDGFFENPENLKDKVIDIGKEKDREIDKTIDKGIIIEKDKSNRNLDIKIKYQKFKKIFEMDCDQLKQIDDKEFCANVKELVGLVGWTQFFNLILGSSLIDALEIINILGISNFESRIVEIRKHHNYFLEKLVK